MDFEFYSYHLGMLYICQQLERAVSSDNINQLVLFNDQKIKLDLPQTKKNKQKNRTGQRSSVVEYNTRKWIVSPLLFSVVFHTKSNSSGSCLSGSRSKERWRWRATPRTCGVTVPKLIWKWGTARAFSVKVFPDDSNSFCHHRDLVSSVQHDEDDNRKKEKVDPARNFVSVGEKNSTRVTFFQTADLRKISAMAFCSISRQRAHSHTRIQKKRVQEVSLRAFLMW